MCKILNTEAVLIHILRNDITPKINKKKTLITDSAIHPVPFEII